MALEHRPFTMIGKGILPLKLKKDIHYKPENYSSKEKSIPRKLKQSTLQRKTTLMSPNQQFASNWFTNPVHKGAPTFWTPLVYKEYRDNVLIPKHFEDWPSKTTPRFARPWSSSSIRQRKPAFSVVVKNSSPKFNKISAESKSEIHDHNSPSTRDSTDSEHTKKPETMEGTLKVLLGNSPPSRKVKFNLEFQDRNETSSEELIERALRLSRKAPEESKKARPTTPRKIAWARPSSADSSYVSGTRATTPTSDWSPSNDPLSASGRKLPYAFRSDRPASASSGQRKSTLRPQSSDEATRKPAWKP